jgi:hypothetical protein
MTIYALSFGQFFNILFQLCSKSSFAFRFDKDITLSPGESTELLFYYGAQYMTEERKIERRIEPTVPPIILDFFSSDEQAKASSFSIS